MRACTGSVSEVETCGIAGATPSSFWTTLKIRADGCPEIRRGDRVTVTTDDCAETVAAFDVVDVRGGKYPSIGVVPAGKGAEMPMGRFMDEESTPFVRIPVTTDQARQVRVGDVISLEITVGVPAKVPIQT